MSEPIIREASPADAGALHEYLVELIGEDLSTITLAARPSTVEQLQSVLKQYADMHNSLFLLAILDDKIVGQLDFAGGWHPKKRHAGGISVSTHRNYRGLGIGTRLMEALFEWVSSNPFVTRIELEVLSNNQRALNLYTRLGFAIEGTKKGAVIVKGKPVDNIIMARLFPNDT